ncbi:MAG: hypothetical protein AMXMBFR58_37460 [Phycisphaerae bacterium]
MPKKSPNYLIDSTLHTAVVVCQRPGCTWRGFAHTKPSAYRLVAAHLRHVHDDATNAYFADRSAREHNRGVSEPSTSSGSLSA